MAWITFLTPPTSPFQSLYLICATPTADCLAGLSSTAEQIATMEPSWASMQPIAVNKPRGSNLIPSICPSWQNKGNSAGLHGPIFAFPAAQLAVGCSSTNASYTCSHSSATPSGLVLKNFLSTSEMDSTGEPKSLLKLYVEMLDMMGQKMGVGELAGLLLVRGAWKSLLCGVHNPKTQHYHLHCTFLEHTLHMTYHA